MPSPLAAVPFLRLLIPLLAGIILQYFFYLQKWALPTLFLGLVIMLLSFAVKTEKEYKWRWLFGVAVYLFVFSVGVFSTSFRQHQSSPIFSEGKASYIGTITDVPQIKPKSIACKVQLEGTKKNIVCYLQPGIRSRTLKGGERISFSGKIQRFKHFGNPDDFNYPNYMYNKGFSGTMFLYSDDWELTEQQPFSITSLALNCRQYLLGFYKSLELDEDEYSIVSALTLGYKDTLSDDLKQSFRATGTAHVLAVSGMHVGIVYAIIVAVVGVFFGGNKRSKYLQLLAILFLWFYAFITGLPPSVIRAAIILTVFCVANVLGRKRITYNNIALSAFLMLLYNPFYLFDVGFQLSFSAVLAICFLQPKFSSFLKLKNNLFKKVWDLFTLSIAAQIGTFPFCLYYFGIFPVYFFLSNLLIIPLVTIIIYLSAMLILMGISIGYFLPDFSGLFYALPLWLLRFTITLMISIIHFFECLPFALVENIKLSTLNTFFLILVIVLLIMSLVHNKGRLLTYSLSVILLGFLIYLGNSFLWKRNVFSIYAKEPTSIEWNTGNTLHSLDSITDNTFIPLNNKSYLSVVSNEWKSKTTSKPFEIDYFHVINNDSMSLHSLTQVFIIRSLIVDRSLSARSKKKLIKECEELNIPYYDLNENGIFRIIF